MQYRSTASWGRQRKSYNKIDFSTNSWLSSILSDDHINKQIRRDQQKARILILAITHIAAINTDRIAVNSSLDINCKGQTNPLNDQQSTLVKQILWYKS